jgi:hypothetical protein
LVVDADVVVDSDRFMSIGGYSLLLTLLNIVCIIFMAIITFTIKIRAKYNGKSEFWQAMNAVENVDDNVADGDEADKRNLELGLADARRMRAQERADAATARASANVGGGNGNGDGDGGGDGVIDMRHPLFAGLYATPSSTMSGPRRRAPHSPSKDSGSYRYDHNKNVRGPVNIDEMMRMFH